MHLICSSDFNHIRTYAHTYMHMKYHLKIPFISDLLKLIKQKTFYFQSSTCCHFCCDIRVARPAYSHRWCEPTDSCAGSLQPGPLLVCLHSHEEIQYSQHLGGVSSWCYTPCHGMDCLHRLHRCRYLSI